MHHIYPSCDVLLVVALSIRSMRKKRKRKKVLKVTMITTKRKTLTMTLQKIRQVVSAVV